MEEELVNLNIINEEDLVEMLGDEIASGEDYRFCLVGRVLMDSVLHFLSMSNVLADLWHPSRRACIMEIGEKRVLFHFYNKIDLKWLVEGMSWFFNKHLIVFHKLEVRIQFKVLFLM
ncbi:hypothetical protein PVK06_020701 [Gossypium arboreum]|uniref:DUF4283 domain-containing protein n=1 Tax=Gossypium arboreum TaxID=29729 RepID=A0ABR0PN21_GOSAR|nr:hypothetical protein PVK06_020701 [Gossypium arboreum]